MFLLSPLCASDAFAGGLKGSLGISVMTKLFVFLKNGPWNFIHRVHIYFVEILSLIHFRRFQRHRVLHHQFLRARHTVSAEEDHLYQNFHQPQVECPDRQRRSHQGVSLGVRRGQGISLSVRRMFQGSRKKLQPRQAAESNPLQIPPLRGECLLMNFWPLISTFVMSFKLARGACVP